MLDCNDLISISEMIDMQIYSYQSSPVTGNIDGVSYRHPTLPDNSITTAQNDLATLVDVRMARCEFIDRQSY